MKIGDIKIKRYEKSNGTSRYVWVACVDCGKERWVRIYKCKGKPQSISCHHCNTLRADPTRKKVVILYPIRSLKEAYLQDYGKDLENHFDVAENVKYPERIFCMDCPQHCLYQWKGCPNRAEALEEMYS